MEQSTQSEYPLHDSTIANPPRRKNRLFIGLGVLLVLAVGAWAYFYFVSQAAERRLQAALAELDQAEPGWQLGDLETGRTKEPDEANSALKVLALRALIPANWPSPEMETALQNLTPPHELHPDQVKTLTPEMDKIKTALEDARKLKDFPNGRFPIVYDPNWIATLLPHVQEARTVASLLAYDALWRARNEDINGAVQSCQAGINVARSIGEEPFLISQLVRIACRAVALARLEYVLGQGQASAPVLQDLQRLLEREETEPIFLIAVRGERAGSHELMRTLKEGKITLAQIAGTPAPIGHLKIGTFNLGDFILSIVSGPVSGQHTAMLQYMTQVVAIAKKPLEEQKPLFEKLESTIPDQPILVKLLAPALVKVSEADRRSAAQLRCAIVMLAAERYRLANQRWPDSLDQLVPDCLLKIYLDPYDKNPLRLKRLEDGIVIYSVGPDGQDNGGNIDRTNPIAAGSDIGLRLWDPQRRRQKPLEPPKDPNAVPADK
ncbi:MAG TPA: hypothetical protein VGY77_09095 [Gemmataceae bacterium]|jgi:hypothetical protein|nr:hypothetical protein [Gemmataceae bacterium]